MGRRAGRVTAVLAAVSLLLVPASGAAAAKEAAAAQPPARAVWLWTAEAPTQVVDWASRRGVTTIFAAVPLAPTAADVTRLRALVASARSAGIRVAALGGDPGWVDRPDVALAWLRAASGVGGFAGYHLDVEPYLLSAWASDHEAVATRYLDLLDRLRAAGGAPLELDVPFWWGQFSVGGANLATETLRRADAVTVMSYRDSGVGEDSIWSISQDWLARGAAAGKPVRLGAETGATPDCPKCSFAEEGATALGAALAQVEAAGAAAPAFGGMAVHHYASWRALPA